jgi:hypothetical protein
MTIIFYTRVGGTRHVGFGLPGWGAAVVAGALITLASAAFFHLGDFAATWAHENDEQLQREYRLARMQETAQRVHEKNRAQLGAAIAKLGELRARMSSLDSRGTSLLAVATAHDDSTHDKRVEGLAWRRRPP